jgi:transcriptional regulator with XRE-family HTH domain
MGYATIRAFAEEVGVNEDRYDKWEKGKALIPPEFVETLKRLFGVTSDWLYFGEESALPRALYTDLRKVG